MKILFELKKIRPLFRMTEGQIEQLFRNTLDPNAEKRRESEEQLQKLSQNKDFVYSLPESFMRSHDPTIRLVSATFFKNAIANDLEINAVKLACQDPANSVMYGEIIKNQISKNVSYMKEFQDLIKQTDPDLKYSVAALLILDGYSELDRSKFSCVNTEALMTGIHPMEFWSKTCNCPRIRATLAKIYDNYHTPREFLDGEFVTRVVSNSLEHSDKDSAVLLSRLSMRSNKGSITLPPESYQKICKFFFDLEGHDALKAEYFILYAQNEEISEDQKQEVLFSLIQSLIIPQFSYKDTDPFEDLKLKYNYSDDTYNSCALLFAEIFKITNKKQLITRSMEEFMTSQNPKERYIGISLFSHIEHLVQEMPEFSNFIKHLRWALTDNEQYVKSQAMYTLQFLDSNSIESALPEIFDIVISALASDDLALKVNASLCLPLFFSNELTRGKVENHLGLIVNSLVHNPLHLESVSETLEIVMDNFDISDYALDISTKMIDAMKLDNIDTTSYLRILSSLILVLEDKKDVVFKIYEKSLPSLYQIINNKVYDFFVETIDFISNVLYVFKTGDQNIPRLIDGILASDHKELVNYSEEMTFLLDNFISYCEVQNMQGILQFASLLCYQDDEYLFEDDFISGCRILESLLLHGKCKGNKEVISFILRIVFDNYSKLENNGLLYALEIIANSFNVDFCTGSTIVYEIIKQDLNKYVSDMNQIRKRFKRVHDKKIGLLFCAYLMQTREMLDVKSFLTFFMHLLLSYDQAEIVRNNLKQNKDVDDEELDESEEEYLEEDVYFSTPLDDVDIKMILKSTFSSFEPEMLGTRVLQEMTRDEKQQVSMIIEERKDY